MVLLPVVIASGCAAARASPSPLPAARPAAASSAPVLDAPRGGNEEGTQPITFTTEAMDPGVVALACDRAQVAANIHRVEGLPALADNEREAFERFLGDTIVGPVQACFVDISPANMAKVQADLVWDGTSIRVEPPEHGGWAAFSDCVETAAIDQRAALRAFPATHVRLHTYLSRCPMPYAT